MKGIMVFTQRAVRRWGWMCGAAALVMLAPSAHARQGAAPAGTPAPAPDMKRLVGDMLTRITLMRLRAVPEPSIADYRIAANSLRLLRPLTPNDPEQLRLEIEAWEGAADPARLEESLRELVKLDPSDTAAQLRLITTRFSKLHRVEDRMAAYLQLLGPKGRSLDPSIRSRLALDAALLSRDNGDETGFIEFLTQAAQLDATNKDAVALASSYFIDRTDDPLEKAKLLADVVVADPTDVGAHFNLAHGLMNLGAWSAARRCLDLAHTVFAKSYGQSDSQKFIDNCIVEWNSKGAAAGMKPVIDLYNITQANINLEHRKAQLELKISNDARPDAALLTVPIESIRLYGAFALGDETMLQQSIALILTQSKLVLKDFEPGGTLPEGFPADRAGEVATSFRLESIVTRLVANVDLGGAEEALALLGSPDAPVKLSDTALARFRAFLDVRWCDAERAIPTLEFLAEGGDNLARLGLAIAAEQRGDNAEAAFHYAIINLNEPLSVLGSAARTKAERLGRPVASKPGVPAIEAYFKEWSPWLEGMVGDPYKFVLLRAELVKPTIDLFERAMVRVQLKNRSRQPLALGSLSTINSRLLFSPDLRLSVRTSVETPRPEVLDLTRRLRLGPGEEIKVEFWPTRGSIGIIMMLYPTDTATVRWRLVQGFQVSGKGGFDTGPMCVTADTGVLQRGAIVGFGSVDELIAALPTLGGRRLLEAVVLMTREMRRRVKDEPEAALTERLGRYAQAVAARMETMTSDERAFTIIVMWHSGIFGTDAGKLIAFGARNDQSPYVRLALMHCAVLTPTDPRLEEVIASGTPIESELAQAVRQSIIESGPYRHPPPEPEE